MKNKWSNVAETIAVTSVEENELLEALDTSEMQYFMAEAKHISKDIIESIHDLDIRCKRNIITHEQYIEEAISVGGFIKKVFEFILNVLKSIFKFLTGGMFKSKEKDIIGKADESIQRSKEIQTHINKSTRPETDDKVLKCKYTNNKLEFIAEHLRSIIRLPVLLLNKSYDEDVYNFNDALDRVYNRVKSGNINDFSEMESFIKSLGKNKSVGWLTKALRAYDKTNTILHGAYFTRSMGSNSPSELLDSMKKFLTEEDSAKEIKISISNHNVFASAIKNCLELKDKDHIKESVQESIDEVQKLLIALDALKSESVSGDGKINKICTDISETANALTDIQSANIKHIADMLNICEDILTENNKTLESMLNDIKADMKNTITGGDTGKRIVEIPFFKESVSKKNDFAVKSILTDMIKRTKGDKANLEEAIQYASKNGAFSWDKYDGKEATTKWDNVSDEFNFEKGRLVQNFCKERYERVLGLLQKVSK